MRACVRILCGRSISASAKDGGGGEAQQQNTGDISDSGERWARAVARIDAEPLKNYGREGPKCDAKDDGEHQRGRDRYRSLELPAGEVDARKPDSTEDCRNAHSYYEFAKENTTRAVP
mmetsp:Transcript_2872/g.7885  ORF Transcript_2872/g.7885 Transcript_2872/m.7885 type:complete len:118 (-) Transcript_2872:189-542(-)